MKRTIHSILAVFALGVLIFSLTLSNASAAQNGGYDLTASLWAKAVLEVPGNPVTLVWKEVGADITPSGDQVVSGYFYADPNDFAYGSQYNPEVFVKIYIATNGWCNIAFNHVTVDNVTISSAHHYSGSAQKTGTVSLASRLLQHQYDGVSIDTSINATAVRDIRSISAFERAAAGIGYTINSDLWVAAVLNPSSGPINLIWKEVGSDTTSSGARVVSGYFYADPNDFAYGSPFNPEVFIKIYIDPNGWANIASNHVTVDSVTIQSAHNYAGSANQTGSVTLNGRLAQHEYTGVTIEEEASVATKVNKVMGMLTTSGEMLTPLSNELTAIIGAISDETSTVPITITPPISEIDLENPPSSIQISLNYGTGYTATDGAVMSGSMNIAITNIAISQQGITLNVAISADQIKRDGVLVLDCEATFAANIAISGDQMGGTLSANIASMTTPAGTVSGQISVTIPGVSIQEGTFQPITISFNNLNTQDIDIISGTVVISSPSELSTQITADLNTSSGAVSGTLVMETDTEGTQTVVNSTGEILFGSYTLDINDVVYQPETCDSYPISGSVLIRTATESHTMTFTGACDSYQFE